MECIYCAGYNEPEHKRICKAMSGIGMIFPCTEDDFAKCPIKKVSDANSVLKDDANKLQKRASDLKNVVDELSQRNKQLSMILFIQRQIKYYLHICDLCDKSVNCLDCPNKNCAEFCRKLETMLED